MSSAELVNGFKKVPMRSRRTSSGGQGHIKDEVKILQKKDSKTEIPSNAKELFTIWTDIEKDILRQGKRINKLIKQIDPTADEACIGVGSRAAGILVYWPDGKVLLGLRNGELIVPGGKAQGEESPIENAVREFEEEFRVKINKKDILENPQLCYYIVDGKYTIHLISAKAMFPEPDKVIEEYKTFIKSTLLVSHENPSELLWIDLYKHVGSFNSFTNIIKESVGVKNFIKKLT
jgi:8-oxo-dGTP pyrophosphatase MutT (NUDIX family)